jgi:heme exporter protein CcmD
MNEFFAMSGYAAYVWSAYAIAVASLVLNAWLARRKLAAARVEARRKLVTRSSHDA